MTRRQDKLLEESEAVQPQKKKEKHFGGLRASYSLLWKSAFSHQSITFFHLQANWLLGSTLKREGVGVVL